MDRKRVRGMFLGIGIGDGLGKPVEMKKVWQIAEKHGRVTNYLPCDGHKFFHGHPPGGITDDTILSMAVAEALIETPDGADLETFMTIQARHHAAALEHKAGGWGSTTKEALQRLKQGVHWSESGKTDKPLRGTGNGVAMKILPFALWCHIKNEPFCHERLIALSLITHYTNMAIASGAVMCEALHWALLWKGTPSVQDRQVAIEGMRHASAWAERQQGNEISDLLSNEIRKLHGFPDLTPEQIVDQFGGGGCYIKYSIPFTLAFWLRNPGTIETVYDLASAGGDTDSNASMGAGLVGALAGEEVFPEHLVTGLTCSGELLDLADRFCDRFGVPA